MGREQRVARDKPKGNIPKNKLLQRQYDKEKVKGNAVRMHDGIFIVDQNGTYRRATKEQIDYLEQLNKRVSI